VAERRDLTFRFLGDTKSLESASSRASKSLGKVDDKSSKASKSVALLGRAGAALGASFAAGRIVSAIGDTVNAASNLAESVNAVEVAAGDASGEILSMGETAAQSLGLSKRAINEAAVAFSAFGEKIDSNNVAGVFEDYITRATDFASVMNLDVNEAIDKFRSGLAGESEPLRRFGLDLSAASVGAYAVANGIAESASKMTEAEKVQARYGLLMQQTAKFAGDFANTSGELANQQRILSAEWENAQAEIGEALLPAMKELIPLLVQGAKWAGTFGKNLVGTVQVLGNLTDAMGLTNDAMFELFRISGHINDRLAEGASATSVAADAMGDLAAKGALSREAVEGVQEATGATTKEMRDALVFIEANADAYGLNEERIANLHIATERYGRLLDEETIKKQDDFAEGARDLAYETKMAAGEVEDLADEAESLTEIMKKAADPVYDAASAVRDYEEALEDAREDGEITGDELTDLALKFANAQLAKEQLTDGSFEAFNEQLEAAAEDAGATADALHDANAAVSGLRDANAFDALAELVERLENLGPITFDFQNLRFATESELEQAMLRVIYSLQRKGSISPIAL